MCGELLVGAGPVPTRVYPVAKHPTGTPPLPIAASQATGFLSSRHFADSLGQSQTYLDLRSKIKL
jgi:hypothetical protein